MIQRNKHLVPLAAALLLCLNLALGDRWYGKHHEICQPLLIPNFPVNLHKCQRRVIPLKQCVGTCLSKDNFDADGKTSCTCCKPVKSSDVTVQLFCWKNGGYVVAHHAMKQHDECACAPCVNGRKRSIEF